MKQFYWFYRLLYVHVIFGGKGMDPCISQKRQHTLGILYAQKQKLLMHSFRGKILLLEFRYFSSGRVIALLHQ